VATSATIADPRRGPEAATEFAARFFGVEAKDVELVAEEYEPDVWAEGRTVSPALPGDPAKDLAEVLRPAPGGGLGLLLQGQRVAHPVADAGDDRSAGPIMELVVDYWPNHYMALYHAGMAEYMLGQRDLARHSLQEFLKYYHESDGFTSNARTVLSRLSEAEASPIRRLPEPPG
jgi:hypothetical protein